MLAYLTYFKQGGKYYSEASVEVDGDLALYQIWEHVQQLNPSPGLSCRWTEGPILVVVPGHRYEHPKLIMPAERRDLNALLAEAVAALKNFENDDGHVPEPIWSERNQVIEKAECLGLDQIR